MGNERWDETWHRLREWTNGQGPAERLAAQILFHDDYENVEPSHPLGGPDGGKDLVCAKHGVRYVVAVYFARGEKGFPDVKRKFDADRENARGSGVAGFIFVTNQELRLAERRDLSGDLNDGEIYHLERINAILDVPRMHGVRRKFLGIGSGDGAGGAGGSGRIIGNRGVVIGGRGGSRGIGGPGGDGGGGFIQGDDGLIVGGDGGSAGTPDGRGGRATPGPMERMNGPTALWKYGRGGSGANDPEYDRRIALLGTIRLEYKQQFPDEVPYIEAGVDSVPVTWVNKRLEELAEKWQVTMGPQGYVMPVLE